MADAMIRRFLFLQGPHGPYFAMLAEALRELGYSAFRINLNGGDKIDWPGEATDYRGTFGTWPLFFDDFIVANGITDLILYGDCRPYHASAHGMARLRGLRVHVVEEGYIRPDFLTLEEDGVNGNSSLPLDPQWYLAQARRLPDQDLPYEPVPSTFKQRAQNTMRHGIASTLWGLYFPFYRTHRSTSFALESVAWGLKLLLRDSDRRKAVKAWDTVKSRRYFTLPLQLNSDYQIRVHSPFADMRAALIFALKSFARHAPADVSLVIKRHPLDPGLVPWERLTHKLAASYGIADRVFYLADWDIAEVVHHSIGVVTVNSTVGTLALNGGKPVTVLGHAVYKVPGIVHHGPLDAFWAAPQAPGLALYDAFRRVLVSKCLIRGGMLSEEGLAMLVRNAVVRLTEERRMDVMPQDKLVPGKVGVHLFPPPSLAQSR